MVDKGPIKLSMHLCRTGNAWDHYHFPCVKFMSPDTIVTKEQQKCDRDWHIWHQKISLSNILSVHAFQSRVHLNAFLMHHFLLHLFDCIILVHVSSRTSPYSINLEAVCFHSRLFQNCHPSHEKFLQRWKILDKKSISWSKNPSFLKMDWYTVHVCSTWWHAFNHRAPDCK